MKNILRQSTKAFFVLLLCTSTLWAQKLTLTGIVRDSEGAPLEMANVVAINQATKALDGFGITDAKGRYRININGNSTYEVKVSFIGYEPATINVKTSGADVSQDVVLEQQAESLDEVELTYEIPVTIKGDTIVYNTDSFATGTEKKLEDLIKNLPGMTVNGEGQIEVEGKSVSKVMIDGKEFFDGDTKLASKNIPAKALDKIEVLRNYSEVGQLRGVTDNQDNVVLNIKLKTGKDKFWFGEFAAAGGADDTFLAHPKLFYYSPTTSVNLITDFNNIGTLPFTTRDYFNFTGGMRNLTRRGGTSFNPASNNLGISLLQNDRAQFIDTKFGAFNFSHSPSEELTLSGFAIYSYTGTDLKNESQRTYIVSNQSENTTSLTRQKSTLGLAKLSSSFKPSAALQWDYDLLYKNSLQDENRSVTSIAQVT
ncbi:MAG TPA: TonB-dependent receptor, partial [Flavobacteriaceae bacterium]|nr:TonB-dependent receptor [Flavobacteriaceae bacterium]